MQKFVIELHIPDQRSEDMFSIGSRVKLELDSMNEHERSRIQWGESFVTGRNIYCVCVADSRNDIEEFGKRRELLITNIEEVFEVVDSRILKNKNHFRKLRTLENNFFKF